MSKFEILILSVCIGGIALPALVFMYYSREAAQHPIVLFLLGVVLVLIGANGFMLLLSLEQPILQLKASGELTQQIIDQLNLQRQLWVFLFPSVAAAIGVNLMSSAITHRASTIPELQQAIARLESATVRLESITRSQMVVLAALVITLLGFLFLGLRNA